MQQFLAVAAQVSSNSSTAAPPAPPLRSRPPRREQTSVVVKEATMADEHQELTKAFSGLGGLGVEENALVSALGRWRKQPEKRSQFRQGFPGFFTPSAAGGSNVTIERCSDEYVKHLKTEFSRFKNLMELVVRVLATRSKPQLRATFRMYEKISGKPLEEEFGGEAPCMREAVRCLDSPAKYFADLIVEAFKDGADKQAKAALTRVVVSRSDADMEEVKEAYLKQHGAKLVDAVAKNTHGHYRDALLAMIGK